MMSTMALVKGLMHRCLLFRECLEDCGLVDVGFTGPKYTWTNKQDANSNVRVRLDCAVANGAFMDMFDNYRVENVITTSSDHLAVAISAGSLALLASAHRCSRAFASRRHGFDRQSIRRSWKRLGLKAARAHWVCLTHGPPCTQSPNL
jgi:hypothetical protein